MLPKKPKRLWHINGWDGATPIYQKTLAIGLLSVPEMERLLQRLVASTLDPDDIVAASLRRGAKGYRPLLEATHRSTLTEYRISVGESPFFTANAHVPLEPE
jgi:hypothetical protein